MKTLLIFTLFFSSLFVYSQSPLELDKLKLRENKQIKILASNPADMEARFALINAYYDEGMLYKKSISRDWIYENELGKHIDTILQYDPSNANAYYIMGLAYFNCYKNKKVEARTNFKKATELNPDFVDAFYWFARCAAQTIPEDKSRDQKTQTLEAYTKVIEMDSKYKDAYFYRGTEYKGYQMKEEAIKDFSSFLDLVPDDEDALKYRGESYYEIKDYCNAGSDFKRLHDLYYGHREYNYYNRMYSECKDNCKGEIKTVEKPHQDMRQKYMATSYYVPGTDEYLLVQENDQVVQQVGMITTKSGYWSISDDGRLMIHNQNKSLVDYFILLDGYLIKDPTANNNYGMNDKYMTAELWKQSINKKNKKDDPKKKIQDIFDIFK